MQKYLSKQVVDNQQNLSGLQPYKLQTLYKTELCKNWITNRSCTYEEKCKFAHGKQELNRKEKLNAFYRTRQCYNFFTKGWCAYGVRCNFQHDVRSFQQIKEDIPYYAALLAYQDLKQCKGFQRRRLQTFQFLENLQSQNNNQDVLNESNNQNNPEEIISKYPNAQALQKQLSYQDQQVQKYLTCEDQKNSLIIYPKHATHSQQESNQTQPNLRVLSHQICY